MKQADVVKSSQSDTDEDFGAFLVENMAAVADEL